MKLPSITAFLLIGALSLAKGEEPDAKAILQKSAEATSALKSFKADMVIETFASLTPQKWVVYQKKQSDGTIAMRMEMLAPTNEITQGLSNIPAMQASYSLFSTQGSYTVMGDKAIKMTGIPGLDKIKDALNPDALKKMTQDAQKGGVNYTLNNGMVDGKDCWVISIPMTPVALETVKKALNSGPQKDLMEAAKMKISAIPIPVKSVISIDRHSLLIIKQDSLDSRDQVLQSITYQNFQPNVEIPDQMFKIPDNIKVEDMGTIMDSLLKNVRSTNL